MKKNLPNQLIIKGVGCCAFAGGGKKNQGGIVIAYLQDDQSLEAHFTVLEPPQKHPYEREDFISAISRAEGVYNIVYNDDENRPLDVYVCRSAQGKIEDFALRDYKRNRFADGLAGIETAHVKFGMSGLEPRWQYGVLIRQTVMPLAMEKYPEGSASFALSNAFNAALLARLFTQEGLYLENSIGERIKIEVCTTVSDFIDLDTLFIRPCVFNSEGFVDYYTSEEFNYIDGNDAYRRAYKIEYKNRLKDYNFESIRS